MESTVKLSDVALRSQNETPRLCQSDSPVKNLLMLGLSFVLNFTSYQGLAALQSSFNSIGGLGTAGLAVTYGCVILSSLTLSPLLIGRLGPKRTMVAALLGYLAYTCLNVYPTWATIIPGSAIVGFMGAPLWASMSVCVMELAEARARHTAAVKENVVPVFFGVFFMLCTSCNVWGNLISYVALTDNNASSSSGGGGGCGAGFCSAEAEDAANVRPEMFKFYVMVGCFAVSSLLSITVMVTLVSGSSQSDRPQFTLATLRRNAKAMAAHMLDARQLLLVPLTVNVGLSQSFAFGEFTEAFVACSSGIASVGRVMMVYGVSQVLAAAVFGAVAGKLGKSPVLLLAAAVQLSLESVSLFWHVDADSEGLLFAFAAVWGAVDTVWNSQMNALYGDFFSDKADAAFSAYRFWESVGYIVGFSYNKLLCVRPKLLIMLGVAAAGVVGFVVSLFVARRPNNSVGSAGVGDTGATTDRSDCQQ